MHVGQVVDLPDHGLLVLRVHDRRARRDAVVAPDRRPETREDLGLDLALLEAVVRPLGGLELGLEHRRRDERHAERVRELALRNPVRESQLGTRDALGRQHQCRAAEQTYLEQVTSA
jgi:hypothetical protein